MTHYVIELALWILLIFFIGCVIGYMLRKLFGRDEPAPLATQPVPPAEPVSAAPLQEETPPAAEAEAVLAPAEEIAAGTSPPAMLRMERPKGLEEARGGTPDPLQRISGVGPKNEKILHTLGFYHFDQIAAWTDEQIAWVDDHLKFNGRIGREEWVEQARLLASGAEEEFASRFGPKSH